jgi:PPP family 3-phenylpropionic acid transporter
MFRIWGAIAAAVGTGGVGYLIEGHAIRTAFLWAAGALAVALLFGVTARSATPRKVVEEVTAKGLVPVLRNRPLLIFLVIVFFVGLFSTVFWNFYGVYFTDIGGASTLFGLAIAVSAAAEVPLYFLAVPIIRRFGIERTLVFTFVCSTLRLFAYAFIGRPQVAIWIELSNGVSWTLFWVAAVEYVNQIVTSEWRATGQSLLNASCWGVAIILGMLGNGYLLDYFKLHVINPWVPLAIQKTCFLSGVLFAGLTVASIVYFKAARRPAPVVDEGITASERAA